MSIIIVAAIFALCTVAYGLPVVLCIRRNRAARRARRLDREYRHFLAELSVASGAAPAALYLTPARTPDELAHLECAAILLDGIRQQ